MSKIPVLVVETKYARDEEFLAKYLAVKGLKICSRCGIAKPLDEYHSAGSGRKRADCGDCRRAYQQGRNPLRRAVTQLKKEMKLVRDKNQELTTRQPTIEEVDAAMQRILLMLQEK